MPCNPSIGGPAKGILVREIDALGGQMAKTADATALQFKMLNLSKGPAVRAMRVQSDKVAYAKYMQEVTDVYFPICQMIGLSHIKNNFGNATFKYYKPQMYKELTETLNLYIEERNSQIEEVIAKSSLLHAEKLINMHIQMKATIAFFILVSFLLFNPIFISLTLF